MISRSTVAIVVLAIAALLGWAFWMGLSVSSGAEIGLLKSERDALRSSYESLNASYIQLSGRYNEVSSDYSKLRGNYSSLEMVYTSLKSDYDSLKSRCDELSSKVERADAIANSATWLSEDGRLNVTSEIAYHWLLGYIVRVNVTNVGDKPLDNVYILLFPYEDDKFASASGYYSDHTTSLYTGETYSHEFTTYLHEFTTYKIIAVAG